jgi:hypothetical protein
MADISQGVLRRLREIYDDPKGVLAQLVDNLDNFNKGRVAEAKGGALGYRTLSTNERAEQMIQGALDNFGSGGLGALGVIKNKGGNWLTSEVAQAVMKAKRGPLANAINAMVRAYPGMDPRRAEALVLERKTPAPAQPHEEALNKWVDGPFSRYIKNDMGTMKDPVRLLADQGIYHVPEMERINFDTRQWGNDWRPGQTWEAKTPQSKLWEGYADSVIHDHPAREYLPPEPVELYKSADTGMPVYGFDNSGFGTTLRQSPHDGTWSVDHRGRRLLDEATYENALTHAQAVQMDKEGKSQKFFHEPWIKTLPPEEKIYGISEPRHFLGDSGFEQMFEDVKKAMTDEKLPAHLKLAPEDLQNMGMEKMIRHLYSIREHEGALKRAMREGLPTVQDFGDGYRFIELNKPGSFASESDAMGHSVRGYEPEYGSPDWTEDSGQDGFLDYGHGGWDAIKHGRARVLSLVDNHGKPKATIEMRNDGVLPLDYWRSYFNSEYGLTQEQFEERATDKYRSQFYDVMDRLDNTPELDKALTKHLVDNGIDPSDSNVIDTLMNKFGDHPDVTQPRWVITQIKGNSNQAPDKSFQPYIQRLIQENNYPVKADHSNAGLVDMNMFTDGLVKGLMNRTQAEKALRDLGLHEENIAGQMSSFDQLLKDSFNY